MFLENTWRYMRGYICIKVEGYFVERFLNLCMLKNIELWNIKKKNEIELTANIRYVDYRAVEEIANITKCKINKNLAKGIPDLVIRYKKRKALICALFLMLIIINIYTSRIWHIEIIGDFTIPIEELWDELKLEGVKIGMRKKDLNYDEIKRNIYLRRDDVAWMGFEIHGTKAYAKIVERKNVEKDELKNEPCNIVSDKDGVVEKILVRTGVKSVNKGDTVVKGQVLISGSLSSENSVSRNVHADGKVVLKTWYINRETVPYEKDVAYKTGENEKKYKLEIGNYQINLINTSTKFEKYDTITVSNQLKLFNKFDLPIKLTELTYEELNVDTITYTKTQAEKIAREKATAGMQSIMSNNNITILNTDYKTFENEDGICVEVTLECLEDVGIEEKI